MHAYKIRPLALHAVLILMTALWGCKKEPVPPTEALESYFPSPGAVSVDILMLGSDEGTQRWLATYTDQEGRTTRFQIEFGPRGGGTDPAAPLPTGGGKFVAETDSDPMPLLNGLKKLLQAKQLPTRVKKAEMLPFNYSVLGEHESRSLDGIFSVTPSGNWMTTKVVLANGKAEVFLNFNSVVHKAELSVKDPSKGDLVLSELAKVM